MGQKLAEAWVEVRGDDTKLPGDLNKSTKEVESWAQKLNSKVNTLITAWLGYHAVLMRIRQAQQLVSHSMDDIDATGKLSDRLGIATEKLTGLRHAADMTGISSRKFDMQLQFLTRSLAMISSRGGDTALFLKSYGIDVQALSTMGVDEAFLSIADAVEKIPDPMQRARVATMLFGRNAQQMMTLLMGGRKEIEATMEEAEKLGLAYSRVDAAQVEAANDAWRRMETIIAAISNNVAIAIAPAIEALSGNIHGATSEMEGFAEAVRAATDEAVNLLAVFANIYDNANRKMQKNMPIPFFDEAFGIDKDIAEHNRKVDEAAGGDLAGNRWVQQIEEIRAENIRKARQRAIDGEPATEQQKLFEQLKAEEKAKKDAEKKAKDDAEKAAADAKSAAEERVRTAAGLVGRYKNPADQFRDEMRTMIEHKDLIQPAEMQRTMAGMILKVMGMEGGAESGLLTELGRMMGSLGIDERGVVSEIIRSTPTARARVTPMPEKKTADFLEGGIVGFADVNRRLQESLATEQMNPAEKELVRAAKEAERIRKEQLDALKEVDKAIREARMPIPVAS
jgi:hypothetical protein